MLADHRDEIVGAHADERVRREWSGSGAFRAGQRGVGTGRREPAKTNDKPGRAGALEEDAARQQRHAGFLDAEELHEPALLIGAESIHQRMHGAPPYPASCADAAWIAARMRW